METATKPKGKRVPRDNQSAAGAGKNTAGEIGAGPAVVDGDNTEGPGEYGTNRASVVTAESALSEVLAQFESAGPHTWALSSSVLRQNLRNAVRYAIAALKGELEPELE